MERSLEPMMDQEQQVWLCNILFFSWSCLLFLSFCAFYFSISNILVVIAFYFHIVYKMRDAVTSSKLALNPASFPE